MFLLSPLQLLKYQRFKRYYKLHALRNSMETFLTKSSFAWKEGTGKHIFIDCMMKF